MKLSLEHRHTIVNALRVAAETFTKDARRFGNGNSPQNYKLSQQFDKQAAEVRTIADDLEDSDEPVDTQVWFEVEYSDPSINDWFSSAISGVDTIEDARLKRDEIRARRDGITKFDYRIVKKTMTTEVVE